MPMKTDTTPLSNTKSFPPYSNHQRIFTHHLRHHHNSHRHHRFLLLILLLQLLLLLLLHLLLLLFLLLLPLLLLKSRHMRSILIPPSRIYSHHLYAARVHKSIFKRTPLQPPSLLKEKFDIKFSIYNATAPPPPSSFSF